MEPGHWALAALMVIAIGVPAVGLVILGRMMREVMRIGQAAAGLVYQEEEKTRARLDELLRRPPL